VFRPFGVLRRFAYRFAVGLVSNIGDSLQVFFHREFGALPDNDDPVAKPFFERRWPYGANAFTDRCRDCVAVTNGVSGFLVFAEMDRLGPVGFCQFLGPVGHVSVEGKRAVSVPVYTCMPVERPFPGGAGGDVPPTHTVNAFGLQRIVDIGVGFHRPPSIITSIFLLVRASASFVAPSHPVSSS